METREDGSVNYDLIEQSLNSSEAKNLLLAFSNWFGLQIFDEEFTEFLIEEGIVHE